jgi:diguanylate cyclase (GGDEF)-like protein/PAS domain S-box-containing protein
MLLIREHRVIAANQTARVELECTEDELLGDGFIEKLLTEDAARLHETLDALERGHLQPNRGDDSFLLVRMTHRPLTTFVELHLRRLDDRTIGAVAIEASQEHRLDAVVAHLASSTFVIDEHGQMVWRPFGNAARLGVEDEQALGAPVLEWIHPEELPELLRLFNQLLETPELMLSRLFRTRQPYVDDGWIVTRITAKNALDDPAVRGIVVRSEEQEEVEQVDSVSRTGGRFQSLAAAAPVGILVTDRDGHVLYRNELATALLGSEEHDDWLAGARATHHDELQGVVDASLRDQREGSVLVPFDRRQGTVWLKIDTVPQTDEAGRPFGLIATLQDVTAETEAREELRQAQDRLWHLANHDQLTGLPNRSLFVDRLEQALARLQRDGHSVAVLYGDLDGFKEINDLYGHHAGDQVLVEVARRLRECIRDTDTACRFGGDEFLILLESFDSQGVVDEIAGRIIESVDEPFDLGGSAGAEAHVGITIGIAVADATTHAGALLARADNAMYGAKATSKGSFVRYERL